jgi:hypothetical protein
MEEIAEADRRALLRAKMAAGVRGAQDRRSEQAAFFRQQAGDKASMERTMAGEKGAEERALIAAGGRKGPVERWAELAGKGIAGVADIGIKGMEARTKATDVESKVTDRAERNRLRGLQIEGIAKNNDERNRNAARKVQAFREAKSAEDLAKAQKDAVDFFASERARKDRLMGDLSDARIMDPDTAALMEQAIRGIEQTEKRFAPIVEQFAKRAQLAPQATTGTAAAPRTRARIGRVVVDSPIPEAELRNFAGFIRRKAATTGLPIEQVAREAFAILRESGPQSAFPSFSTFGGSPEEFLGVTRNGWPVGSRTDAARQPTMMEMDAGWQNALAAFSGMAADDPEK